MKFYLRKGLASWNEFNLMLYDRAHPVQPIWGFRALFAVALAALYYIDEEPRTLALVCVSAYALFLLYGAVRFVGRWIKGKHKVRQSTRRESHKRTTYPAGS